jgi:hypothetical protein
MERHPSSSENSWREYVVKTGQLRQWNICKESWMPTGPFLVLDSDPNFSNGPFWRVLKADGSTKIWSETRIAEGSEVISEVG